jgi:hypothetical protein
MLLLGCSSPALVGEQGITSNLHGVSGCRGTLEKRLRES